MTAAVHDMLDTAGMLRGEHAVDAGYTSADLLLTALARGITLLGPLLANVSPQARAAVTLMEQGASEAVKALPKTTPKQLPITIGIGEPFTTEGALP